MEQMFVKFVMGKEPIENFDAHIATLKKTGMEDAIKILASAASRSGRATMRHSAAWKRLRPESAAS